LALALPAPLSVTAETADSSASPPVAEGHEHPAHGHDSGSDRHVDSSSRDAHETASGVAAADPDHGTNTSEHMPDDEHHLHLSGKDHDEHGHGHD
jgi:hypothetical protein